MSIPSAAWLGGVKIGNELGLMQSNSCGTLVQGSSWDFGKRNPTRQHWTLQRIPCWRAHQAACNACCTIFNCRAVRRRSSAGCYRGDATRCEAASSAVHPFRSTNMPQIPMRRVIVVLYSGLLTVVHVWSIAVGSNLCEGGEQAVDA